MLTGTLVQLREYRKEDIPLVKEYINDPEVTWYTRPGIPYPFTLEDEQRWIESKSAMNDTYSFAIETLKDRLYIGDCSVTEADAKNSRVSIGMFIGPAEYRGRGYGTDALNVLISFIFDQMNIHKIKLEVYAYNTRAIKCYERCGFRKEGELRDEIFKNGAYQNLYIMGLLREDWQLLNHEHQETKW